VSRAQGVGPKVAQRIVSELKDKVPAFVPGGDAAAPAGDGHDTAAQTSAAGDAVSALVNLGYGLPQANGAVAVALREASAGAVAAELIRRGLKDLAR